MSMLSKGTELFMFEGELFKIKQRWINQEMNEDKWKEMLANATSETYYSCDVEVNGQKYKNVGIRPKGNTSLSSIAMNPDTDRFSFKLEFDHFADNQTCFGLDKLVLNNNFADATNMKEAIIYDMYQYLDVDAALYNYAKINVNGEYWGVYLALEGIDDSFKLRNYGTLKGKLYKPENMGGGKDKGKGFGKPGGKDMPAPGEIPNMNGEGPSKDWPADFDPANMKGAPDMMSSGSNLNYSDDKLDSYSAIWDSAVNGATNSDKRKVVSAIKAASEGTNLESYLDIDNLLKYMAVHTFAVNADSLSGMMAHNYYLYEDDGKLNIIPWDYNLSFGGMGMNDGSATEVINDAIDTPFQATHFFDKLLENKEYSDRYHEYLNMLVEEYVDGGRFDECYQRIRKQIDQLVATDPTAFYNEDEYNTAAEMLYKTIKLRGESIKGQLNGEIPSTDFDGRETSPSLIDGSEIDIKSMGQMNMGNKPGRGDRNNNPGQEKTSKSAADKKLK